jgi:hypothetical protein
MVACPIICGVSPMVCQRPAVTVRWTTHGVIRGLRLGVRRRLPPEHEQESIDRGSIAPGGGAEDLPSAGGPTSPPSLLTRHRQRLCHLREGLGQLDDRPRPRLERLHLQERVRGLRRHTMRVLELSERGQIECHLLLRLVQPPLVRVTELRPKAVLKVLQPLRQLFQPRDELGEPVGARSCGETGVGQRVHSSYGSLGSVGRCEPQHGANDPFHGAMILLHEVFEILALLDGDGGSMLLVVAPNGRGIGLAPTDGDRPGDTMATDRLGEEARGRLLVAQRREQEIDGLATLIHRAIEVALLAFDFDIRFIHPPAEPD